MAESPLVVYVLDDDEAVRTGLCRYFRAAGLCDRPFASVDELVAGLDRGKRSCVLFDLSIVGREATRLVRQLRERGLEWPLIAISGRCDAHAGRDARAAGAEFLFRKPIDGRALLDAIEWLTAKTA